MHKRVFKTTVVLDEAVAEKLKELQMKRGYLTIGEAIRAVLGEYFAEGGGGGGER